MRWRVIFLVYFIITTYPLIAQEILITTIKYSIYENNEFITKEIDLDPKNSDINSMESIFYSIEDNIVVRYFYSGNVTDKKEFDILEYSDFHGKKKIYAKSNDEHYIEINLFFENNAIIIYYNKNIIIVEEAIYNG